MFGKCYFYFADGNTSKGYKNFFDSNLRFAEKIVVLDTPVKTISTELLHRLSEKLVFEGKAIEIMNCALDTTFIDAIYIPEYHLGFINSEAGPLISSDKKEYLDIKVNHKKLPDPSKIEELKEKNHAYLQKAYSLYAEALVIHDQWEAIYINNMNFDKHDEYTKQIIDMFFEDNTNASTSKGWEFHRFLGAATPYGSVDYIDNLTSELNKRYFLKGRPGTGKSTLLKKLYTKAINLGFNCEIYHCGFDPESIDMVIVRQLGKAIFDSTKPHEYFPSKDNDEIIDLYSQTVKEDTDQRFEVELEEIAKSYREKIVHATKFLFDAKEVNDEIESLYDEAYAPKAIKATEGKLQKILKDYTK